MAKTKKETRTETDTFGKIEVTADRYWGAQTERSRQNFRIGTEHMPLPLIRALALVKRLELTPSQVSFDKAFQRD